jgi:putative DNA primase/helicase
MWVGGGSNGKGVLARVLAHCFGDYAETPSDTLYMRTKAATNSSQARPDLLRLQSARFTYMSEPPGGQFNEELLKAHTGEDEILARDLWAKAGQMARFAPTHKIVFLTNDPPKTDDVGNSMSRRVRVLYFLQTYIPDGGVLEDHLKTQQEAIMAFVVRLAGEWLKSRSLPEPEQILKWSKDYIEENDPLADFINVRCVVDVTAKVGSSSLWVAYQEWATANGVEMMSRTGFGLAMKRRFPNKDRDERGAVVYKGIRVKNATEVAAEESE